MHKPLLSIVVAMNKNRVIGKDNKLPWHIPEDLKHFKKTTLNKPVIMGRKTFESIGRILPNRKNIVLTRNFNWEHSKEIFVYSSLEKALKDNDLVDEICIIGGAKLFEEAIAIVDKMYITIIDKDITHPYIQFPELDYTKWLLISSTNIITQNNTHCEFKEYQKKNVLKS